MVICRRGRSAGTTTAAGGSVWRRRNAVLWQGVLQYRCRPVGVKQVWHAGQRVVAGASRDGPATAALAAAGGVVPTALRRANALEAELLANLGGPPSGDQP